MVSSRPFLVSFLSVLASPGSTPTPGNRTGAYTGARFGKNHCFALGWAIAPLWDPLFVALGLSWDALGRSLGALLAFLAALWAPLGALWAPWVLLGCSWTPLGTLKAPSWPTLGAPRRLSCSPRPLGRPRDRSEPCFERFSHDFPTETTLSKPLSLRPLLIARRAVRSTWNPPADLQSARAC